MKKLMITASILVAGMLCFYENSFAHGGQWRGPGDTVPPGGGTPGGPSTPSGPSGPSTPSGPAGPSGPSTPSGPGAPPAGPTGPAGSGPTTQRGIDLTESLDGWTFWWEFNKERFLNLKEKIHSVGAETDSPEFYLGLKGGSAKDTIGISREMKENDILPLIRQVLQEAVDDNTNAKRAIDEVSSALVALGKLGIDPQQSIKDMMRFLSNSNQEIQETAAVAIGILADPEGIEVLQHVLADDQKARELCGSHEVALRTRAFAGFGLGLIGYYTKGDDFAQVEHRKKIAETLVSRLKADTSAIKDIKIACVASLGIISYSAADRKTLLEPLVFPVFDELLMDKNSKNIDLIRAHIPTAVMRILRQLESAGDRSEVKDDREKYVKTFTQLLADKKEDQYLRQSLVLALAHMVEEGDGDSYKKVVRLFQELNQDGRSQQERYFTSIALGQMGGDDAVKFLLDQVLRGKTLYQPWAALGLGVYGFNLPKDVARPSNIAQTINLAMTRMKAPEYKGACALALGLLRDKTSKDLLLTELKESNVEAYKGYCGVGLGLMGASEAKEDIREEVKKSTRKPTQLQQLAIGLGLLGDKEVVDLLLEMMGGKQKTTSVYAAISQALGFVGDARSVAPLIQMINNRELTGEARAFAMVALGIVGDKEPLPWNNKFSENINYRASVTTLTGSTVGILDIL